MKHHLYHGFRRSDVVGQDPFLRHTDGSHAIKADAVRQLCIEDIGAQLFFCKIRIALRKVFHHIVPEGILGRILVSTLIKQDLLLHLVHPCGGRGNGSQDRKIEGAYPYLRRRPCFLEEKMAATRLIALHATKGRSVAGSLGARPDYAKNPEKTEKGELVTAYGCDPMTADEEFMLQKRLYSQVTGKSQKRPDAFSKLAGIGQKGIFLFADTFPDRPVIFSEIKVIVPGVSILLLRAGEGECVFLHRTDPEEMLFMNDPVCARIILLPAETLAAFGDPVQVEVIGNLYFHHIAPVTFISGNEQRPRQRR